MPYILQTNHLTKTIDGKTLVDDVNIHIKKGEIYGFLGPNGAGKTTIMKMITNLWKPTDGHIEIFGEALTPQSYEVLKRMGSIIEFPTFYDHMTGYQNLRLHCEYMGYYQHGSIENALDMLSLTGMASMGFYVQLIVKSAVIVTMSFIALFIGLAMKSSKATIVSSFLLILLTQANVGDLTMANNAVFTAILTLIALAFAFLSICGVETKDLM